MEIQLAQQLIAVLLVAVVVMGLYIYTINKRPDTLELTLERMQNYRAIKLKNKHHSLSGFEDYIKGLLRVSDVVEGEIIKDEK